MQVPNPRKMSNGYRPSAKDFTIQRPRRFRGSARAFPAAEASIGGPDQNRKIGDTPAGTTRESPANGRFGLSVPGQPFDAEPFCVGRYAAASRIGPW